MPVSLEDGERIWWLTSWEVYNSVFERTREKIKLEIYRSKEEKVLVDNPVNLTKVYKVVMKNLTSQDLKDKELGRLLLIR